MSINRAEHAILTMLLKNKLPNTRNSSIILSRSTLPIRVEDELVIENISEVKNTLTSLENKGIIVIEQMETIQHQGQKPLSETKVFNEIEKLNIMYILEQLSDSDYEKLFANTMKRSQNSSSHVLPLTLIQKYLYLIKNHLTAISYINFEYYNEYLLIPDLKMYNSTITESSIAFINAILNVLMEYIKHVKNLVDNCDAAIKDTKLFIYLYPFVLPFAEKVKKRAYVSESKQVEQIKKEIQVEKEIIDVLELLKEEERKINLHRSRLWELEKRLEEIEKYEEREVYILMPIVSAGKTFSMEDLLIILFDRPPSYITNMLREFTYMLYSLMLDHLFGKARGDGVGNREIDLQLFLNELQKEGAIKSGDQLIVKVSLTWMNEFCPAMQDSTIDSEGRELELCKNPECFVVYHKKCLDSLREAGVDSCLVCGKPT